MKKILQNNWLYLIVIIFFSSLLALPFLKKGFPVTDDGIWMIVRLSDFHESLKNGQFPVRWAGRLNHEFGYPVFNFLYPGVLYLGEIVHLTGFDFINSIKIIFILSIVFSGIFSYLWLKSRLGKFAALVGSLIYLYFPYHIFDLYKRGSLGEVCVLAAVPLVLWGIDKKNMPLAAISLGAIITFHNTLALLFLPVFFIYSLVVHKPFNIKNFLFIFLGLGISCFFWLPALYDRKYTIFDSINISQWNDFFLNKGNFYLLGWGSILMLVISLALLFSRKNKNKISLFFIILFLFSTFFASPLSSFLWQFPLLPKLVQFPWRFLSLTAVSVSFLSASIINLNFRLRCLLGIFLLIPFLLNFPTLNDLKYEYHNNEYYSTNEDTTTVKNEYLPKWTKTLPVKRPEKKVEIINGTGSINLLTNHENNITFQADIRKDALIKINTLFFPGWVVKIDAHDQKININNDGTMSVSVPKGMHVVKLLWQETGIRLISDLISLFTIILLGLNLIGRKKKRGTLLL